MMGYADIPEPKPTETHAWIESFKGNPLYLEYPENSMIDFDDIAHALSHLCRFTGHCQKFYSIATHSVLVSHLVDSQFALHGLFHDAQEYVLGDMSSPLKQLVGYVPTNFCYAGLEYRWSRAIDAKFNIVSTVESEKAVKAADYLALAIERSALMRQDTAKEWDVDHNPLTSKSAVVDAAVLVVPLDPAASELQFRARAKQLGVVL